MLEKNADELADAITRELEENPALERIDETSSLLATEEGMPFTETATQLQEADYASHEEIPYSQPRHQVYERDTWRPDVVDDTVSLYDYLGRQLLRLNLTPTQERQTALIVGNLDTHGYLRRELPALVEDLAINEDIECNVQDMERALAIVQGLDPAGVGARDLREMMLLQLQRMAPSQRRDDALTIVRDGFDLFMKRHFQQIGRAVGLSRERAEAAVALIRSLNPMVGGTVSSGADSVAIQVVPEYAVDVEKSQITISLPTTAPTVAVSQSYELAHKEIQNRPKNHPTEPSDKIVNQEYKKAKEFVDMLEGRSKTMTKVMENIVEIQRQYFLTGDETKLRPMTLKDLAENTKLDKSTISRATSDKYVDTPYGILPLRFFFSEGFEAGGEGDEDISARRIQARLRQLIEGEDKRRPLSDDALTKILQDEGLPVARRTVAKYRDKLGFLSSRLRRITTK